MCVAPRGFIDRVAGARGLTLTEQIAAPPAARQASSARPLAEGQQFQARVAAHSDVGRVRGNNEDRLLVLDLARNAPVPPSGAVMAIEPPGLLLIVADGMGGMMAGERASQMCVDRFPASLLKHLKGAAGKAAVEQALADALLETHQAIYQTAVAEQLKGMGTTMTAVVLQAANAWIVQVGDSRAYLGRGGSLQQITRDQTVWETMLAGRESAVADSEVFRSAPWKNMLLQALGAQAELQVVVTEHAMEHGDWLLLCSDGLYRVVQPEDMAATLAGATQPAEKARELVELANQRGGPDNVSAVVCQLIRTQ